MRTRLRGFSTLELLVSLPLAAILTTALVSSIFIALRAVEIGSGSQQKIADSARALESIQADLRLALLFIERTSTSVEFTVPDRDGDQTSETIRYEWLGDPVFEIRKTLTYSKDELPPPTTVLAGNVEEFNLDYLLRTWGPPPQLPDVESEETLLLWHDDRPEGDGIRLLLVVGNPVSLTSQEALRKSFVESVGFTVELIGTDASQVEFNDASDRNDLVYVPQQIDAAELGDKLKLATIGIASENIDLAQNLGLAGSAGAPLSSYAIDMTSCTHYICHQYIPGDSTALFESSQPLAPLPDDPAAPAPGLRSLWNWGATPGLAFIEPGRELHGGFTGPSLVVGEQAVLPAQSNLDEFEKMHVAASVTVPTGAKMTSISVHLYLKNDKDMRFGVYSDAGGAPGDLLGQTLKTRLEEGTGWYTLELEEPVNLQPGVYWLAVGMQKDVALFYTTTGGSACWGDSDEDPKDGLMPTWMGTYGPDPNEYRYSIHANYRVAEFAAGRRVQLPWGGPGFEFNSLTDDGRLILERALKWAGDTTSTEQGESCEVKKLLWPGQYFLPQLPTNATGWTVTRIFLAVQANEDKPDGKIRFRLHYVTPDMIPTLMFDETSEFRGEETWDFDDPTWFQIPLNATGELNPDHGIALTLKGRTTDYPDAFVLMDDSTDTMTSGTHFLISENEGDSWTGYTDTQDLRIYVFGTYLTSGDPRW